jgi:hypothetical protein
MITAYKEGRKALTGSDLHIEKNGELCATTTDNYKKNSLLTVSSPRAEY